MHPHRPGDIRPLAFIGSWLGRLQPRTPNPQPQPGERCPLCRFPTHAFAPGPEGLPAEVLDRIRTDFPTWEPLHGLCQQCADLYRARRSAAATPR